MFVYTMQPVVQPRLSNRPLVEQLVFQPVECFYTRYNRFQLSERACEAHRCGLVALKFWWIDAGLTPGHCNIATQAGYVIYIHFLFRVWFACDIACVYFAYFQILLIFIFHNSRSLWPLFVLRASLIYQLVWRSALSFFIAVLIWYPDTYSWESLSVIFMHLLLGIW